MTYLSGVVHKLKDHMAKVIQLKHSATGLTKDGFYGFSWTTLFFGPFVPLFRGDFLTFLGYLAIVMLIGLITAGIGGYFCFIIWAFFYNGYYTKKLIENGYKFFGTHEQNSEAAKVLGVQITNVAPSYVGENELDSIKSISNLNRNLKDDAYKIFLVKKYPIEFNEVLKKHVFDNKLYDSIDDVLLALHEIESEKFDAEKRKSDFNKAMLDSKIQLLRLEAKPFLDIILNNKYNLIKENLIGDSIIWEFETQESGSTFKIDSIEQLKIFSKYFK